jgi:phenol 2-monooxygenase (NADPH)
MVQQLTLKDADPDMVVQGVLVLASDRRLVEKDLIPGFFTPVTGKWGIQCKEAPILPVAAC